jgi:hypothetical protein
MSDPAESVEIEDVLASVRRLVAAGRRDSAPSPTVRPSEEEAGKLVLTADFRVASPAPHPERTEALERAAAPQAANGPQAEDAPVPEALQEAAMPAESGNDPPGDGPAKGAKPGVENGAEKDAERDEWAALIGQLAEDARGAGASAAPPRDEPAAARILTLEERIAQLEAAVVAHSGAADFEPDGSEDQKQHVPEAILGLGTRPAETVEETAARFSFTDSGADEAEDGPTEDEGSTTGRRPETMLFRRRTHPLRQPEAEEAPGGAEDDDETFPLELKALEEVLADAAEDSGDAIAAAEDREAAPDAEDAAEDADRRAAPDPLTLYAAADASEQALDLDEEDEDELEDADEAESRTVPFPTRSRSRTGAGQPEDGGQDYGDWEDRIYNLDTEAEVAGLSFDTDTQEIDEELLRDMVAEIVREELQGALGERITRNVRKLVRREIMRALSIREFE